MEFSCLEHINEAVLADRNKLQQFDLERFPVNRTLDFYRNYLLSLLEKRIENEKNRTIAYEKISNINEKSPKYQIYRREFMYHLIRGTILDKYIEKSRAIIKENKKVA